MTGRTLRALVVLVLLSGIAQASQPGPVNACTAVAPAARSCTLVMEGDGAYVATGSWRITVRRAGAVLVRDSEHDPVVGQPGAVVAGDEVTAEALAPGSSVTVSRALSTTSSARVPCASGDYGTGGAPVRRKGLPDDPLLDLQWGLRQARVLEAWQLGARGRGVVVAVVDTGVDLQHPDLAGQLLPGKDLWEARTGGVADCPGPDDEQYHGTRVAGVVAAAADDGRGIAGVAPAARILPVRVRADVDSQDYSQVGPGIRWAADHGADVISLTGGVAVPIRPDPVIEEDVAEALAYAWSRGVVTVATAGNNSLPWCQYPSSSPHVVCASATDRGGAVPSYAQLPFRTDGGVAVLAPGGARAGTCAEDVVSSTPPEAAATTCGSPGWAADSGTTYATAHTAGIAALLVGRGLDNVQVLDCLRRTSSGRGSYDPRTGYGVVNAADAVRECRA